MPENQEIERLQIALGMREGLRVARNDVENSEIASLKRRLAERDRQLRALEAIVSQRTAYLYGALTLLGLMLVSAWF